MQTKWELWQKKSQNHNQQACSLALLAKVACETPGISSKMDPPGAEITYSLTVEGWMVMQPQVDEQDWTLYSH